MFSCITDLSGTLANTTNRLHMYAENKKKNMFWFGKSPIAKSANIAAGKFMPMLICLIVGSRLATA